MDEDFSAPGAGEPVSGDIVRIGSATWRARPCECGGTECDGWRLNLIDAPEGPARALAAVDAGAPRRRVA